jgi:Translation initiation factor eIF3 subunit
MSWSDEAFSSTDEEEEGLQEVGAKWDDDEEEQSDDDIKGAWDEESDDESKKQEAKKPGVSGKAKVLVHKKKKKFAEQSRAEKEAAYARKQSKNAKNESKAEREARLRDQQRDEDVGVAKDLLFGDDEFSSDDDSDDDDDDDDDGDEGDDGDTRGQDLDGDFMGALGSDSDDGDDDGDDGGEVMQDLNKVDLHSIKPRRREEFEKLAALTADVIRPHSRSRHFGHFVSTLIRDLSDSMQPEEIKQVISTLNRLANEKIQAQRGRKKTSKRPTLRQVGKGADDAILDDLF